MSKRFSLYLKSVLSFVLLVFLLVGQVSCFGALFKKPTKEPTDDPVILQPDDPIEEDPIDKPDISVTDPKLLEIMDFVLERQASNCEAIGATFLHASDKNGLYAPVKAAEWTAGFYPGLNYLCYEMSGEDIFKDTNALLLPQLPDPQPLGHDIGMIFIPSSYAHYKIFGSMSSRNKTIAAGEALLNRYRKNGEYIKAWDWGGSINDYRMIIDTMYNLPLLFRCYELTGDKDFYDVAVAHSKTAQRYLVRDDDTTAHTYIFQADGTPSHEMTHQGYADDSCWARGQAWALSGYAMAYRFTGDESFLETSIGLAEKYLDLCEDNLIPKWDLIFQGDATQPVDTSAAAIAANGFMELYDATGNAEYREYAYRILIELYENYSSKDLPEHQGLIREAVGHMPAGKNVSVSLIYGDYFFVELLSRFLGTSKGYW